MSTPPRPPKSKPAKAVKARRMFLAKELLTAVLTDRYRKAKGGYHSVGLNPHKDDPCKRVPVFVIDGSPEAIEQMRRQLDSAASEWFASKTPTRPFGELLLASLGLVAPRDGKKKQK